MEKDLSGNYTEYAFDKPGEREAEGICFGIAAQAPLGRGTTNNGWVDSWVYFEGQHIAPYENGGVYYIYSNQVGTAGFVTDWTGAVVQDELHYPWGKHLTSVPQQPMEERFASLHHRDSQTHLDPTHFRMYSSDEGRWLTPDPAQADIYNPQSMSRYAYAEDGPLDLVDPLGTGPCNFVNGHTYNCMPDYMPGYQGSGPSYKPTKAANTWLGQNSGIYNPGAGTVPGSGFIWSSCSPTGLSNSCNPASFTLGSQTSLGFTHFINQLECDAAGVLPAIPTSYSKIPGVSQAQAVQNLRGWQTWTTQGLPGPAKASIACNAIYGPAMEAWEANLQAWLKANPNQPPPSWITTPPQLSGGCG